MFEYTHTRTHTYSKKSGVGMNIYYWCAYKILVTSNKFHLFNLKNTQSPVGPSSLLLNIPFHSKWHYSPGWALASATICLQSSRCLALSLQSVTPIFLRSMDTSSSHLIFGRPLRLVAYSFPYNIFFGIAVTCILST